MFQKNLPWLAFAIVVLSGLLIGFFQWNQASNGPITINNIAVPPLPMLDENAIAQGEILYQQYCAACHMPDLSGAPDWKKPLPDGSLPPLPHDDAGHTWHHPDFLLLQILSEGGVVYDGVMPGFAEQLSPDEMEAILEFLKSHWSRKSREYQWWLTNTYPTPNP
jgi:mono/diheme cytochrome c family protein